VNRQKGASEKGAVDIADEEEEGLPAMRKHRKVKSVRRCIERGRRCFLVVPKR
jgi:hypothetical protein